MDDFAVDSANRSAFQRLSAGSAKRSGQDKAREAPPSPRRTEDSQEREAYDRLEQAVQSTNESAETLDRVRSAVEDVQRENSASAQSEVRDVEDAADMAMELSTKISGNERQASEAQAAQLTAAAIQRLLG